MNFSIALNKEIGNTIVNGICEGCVIAAKHAGRLYTCIIVQLHKRSTLTLIAANLLLMALAAKVSSYVIKLLANTSFSEKTKVVLANYSYFTIFLAGNCGLILMFNPSIFFAATVAAATFAVVLALKNCVGTE